MPQVIERLDEFIARHGGDMVQAAPRVWLFADGASLTNAGDGSGPSTHEPPADPTARLTARRKYHAAKLAAAEKGFHDLKAALMGRQDGTGLARKFTWDAAAFGPAPTDRDRYGRPCGKAALVRLSEVAARHRAAVAEIDARLNQSADTASQRERAADDARRAALHAADAQAIAAIHL